jgi:hypothetical protein
MREEGVWLAAAITKMMIKAHALRMLHSSSAGIERTRGEERGRSSTVDSQLRRGIKERT